MKVIFKNGGQYGSCFGESKYQVNLSDELSFLIKEAAKNERHASDLFIEWSNVVNMLSQLHRQCTEVFWFGFRDNGVDNDQQIRCLTEPDQCICEKPKLHYRKLYRFEIEFGPDFNNYRQLSNSVETRLVEYTWQEAKKIV